MLRFGYPLCYPGESGAGTTSLGTWLLRCAPPARKTDAVLLWQYVSVCLESQEPRVVQIPAGNPGAAFGHLPMQSVHWDAPVSPVWEAVVSEVLSAHHGH